MVSRTELKTAKLVGLAGCYPTAVQLALKPLISGASPLIDESNIVADCKSGVSGAGRKAAVGSLFSEAAESFKAYGVSGHRHLPEIEQGLELISGRKTQITFTPHLVPMVRGILATTYVKLNEQGKNTDIQALYEQHYANEYFVDVMPKGSLPETKSVRGSNFVRIALHRPQGRDTLVIVSVIDNLVKGAAGQAVQAMNVMFDLPEHMGLEQLPLAPITRILRFEPQENTPFTSNPVTRSATSSRFAFAYGLLLGLSVLGVCAAYAMWAQRTTPFKNFFRPRKLRCSMSNWLNFKRKRQNFKTRYRTNELVNWTKRPAAN